MYIDNQSEHHYPSEPLRLHSRKLIQNFVFRSRDFVYLSHFIAFCTSSSFALRCATLHPVAPHRFSSCQVGFLWESSLYIYSLSFLIYLIGCNQSLLFSFILQVYPTASISAHCCHTVKLFHSRNISFGLFLLHYKFFLESTEKLMNH
jgi:hypothetical protein